MDMSVPKIKPGQEGSLGADCRAQTHEGRDLKIKIFGFPRDEFCQLRKMSDLVFFFQRFVCK